MKIIDDRQKTKMKNYQKLNSGDTFLYKENLYLVTDLKVGYGGEALYSCCLSDGSSVCFDSCCEVEKVVAEVIIKE